MGFVSQHPRLGPAALLALLPAYLLDMASLKLSELLVALAKEMVVEKVFAQRDVFQAFRAGANIPAGNLINQKEAHALAPMVTGFRLPCQHISRNMPIGIPAQTT
jgi:hypothetical protein